MRGLRVVASSALVRLQWTDGIDVYQTSQDEPFRSHEHLVAQVELRERVGAQGTHWHLRSRRRCGVNVHTAKGRCAQGKRSAYLPKER